MHIGIMLMFFGWRAARYNAASRPGDDHHRQTARFKLAHEEDRRRDRRRWCRRRQGRRRRLKLRRRASRPPRPPSSARPPSNFITLGNDDLADRQRDVPTTAVNPFVDWIWFGFHGARAGDRHRAGPGRQCSGGSTSGHRDRGQRRRVPGGAAVSRCGWRSAPAASCRRRPSGAAQMASVFTQLPQPVGADENWPCATSSASVRPVATICSSAKLEGWRHGATTGLAIGTARSGRTRQQIVEYFMTKTAGRWPWRCFTGFNRLAALFEQRGGDRRLRVRLRGVPPRQAAFRDASTAELSISSIRSSPTSSMMSPR